MKDLPAGVRILPLAPQKDGRGMFIEIFRRQWSTGFDDVQWNAVSSRKGTLRGVHVHPLHDDYLVVLVGRASIGLKDLRRGSPTEGTASVVDLEANSPAAIFTPHGVAHGFLFHEDSFHVYAVSRYWDPEDELGCRWDDPDLGIAWPFTPTLLSKRDQRAPSLRELVRTLDGRTQANFADPGTQFVPEDGSPYPGSRGERPSSS